MALRREIVDLGRLGFLDDADQIGAVRHVSIMQMETGALDMRILVDVLDARGVERRRASLDAMDDIALLEQQLGKVGAILPGNTGDQRNFIGHRQRSPKRSLQALWAHSPHPARDLIGPSATACPDKFQCRYHGAWRCRTMFSGQKNSGPRTAISLH
jgi:hypothetical protein